MTEPLLSDAERKAMGLTAQLANLVFNEVIGHGPSREQDCAEFTAQIHAVQHTVMAQAAARAYPSELRLLGEVLHSTDGSDILRRFARDKEQRLLDQMRSPDA